MDGEIDPILIMAIIGILVIIAYVLFYGGADLVRSFFHLN